MSAHRAYSFGDYTLDLRRGALLKAGTDIRLRPKSFEVLRFLVERHGQLVTKDELLDGVWGRTVVTEGSITQCLMDVRRAIGDESQQVVRTVQRRGYIFDAPVIESDGVPSEVVTPADGDMSPVEAPGPNRSRPGHVGTRAAAAAMAILLLVVAGIWVGKNVGHRDTRDAMKAGQSIAVLPFVDLSAQKDQQFLSDGITEEILDRLANAGSLLVIARTSSFAFRDRPLDIPTIAAKLGVSHVLEGSVRRSGDHIRVTAQLVDTATNSHIWSRTYDRSLGDLFAVQDEIAGSVATTLQATLASAGSHSAPPASGAAYERFLQARYFVSRRAPGDLERAIKYFEEAVAIDARFARAWAGLSGAYRLMAWDGDHAAHWRVREGEAARRAVELEPDLVDGRLRLGVFYYETGRFAEALEQFQQASALDPTDAWLASFKHGFPAWQDSGLASYVADERHAVERDPLSAVARHNLGIALFAAGRLDEALAEFEKALDLNPDRYGELGLEIGRVFVAQRHFDEAYAAIMRLPPDTRDFGLALLYDDPERRVEAEAALVRLTQTPGDYGHDLRVAELLVLRDRREEAFAWLQRARDGLTPDEALQSQIWYLQAEMYASPFLKPLHADPRWAALMATL